MCGIVGIISQGQVAQELYDSLVHLQHRGQDAAGILTCGERFHTQLGEGLVREIFNDKKIQQLPGKMGIAHARYPTAGGYSSNETQPFWIGNPYGIGLAHNGNLINYSVLRDELIEEHRHLNSSSDSEALLYVFAQGLDDGALPGTDEAFFEKICHAMQHVITKVSGAYSAVSVVINKGLIAFRDPHGIRPLVCGERNNAAGGKDRIFASEPTMFYSLGFTQVGDVLPGEVVFVSTSGNIFRRVLAQASFNPCVFEYVYFARPDAMLNNVSVYRSRLRMGQNLAKRWKEKYPDVLPDIVIPAPSTANTAALSFAAELGVRYSEGLYKNPFIGRTFIMPSTKERRRSVQYKLTPQPTEIVDKKVLILDDSIVRGTTSREIVRMVKEVGAKEVYFASAAPPIKFPCFYGIDIPTRKELIADALSEEGVARYLEVDKMVYQTIEDLTEAVTRKGDHHIDSPCLACMNGCYVTGDVTEEVMKTFETQRTFERGVDK